MPPVIYPALVTALATLSGAIIAAVVAYRAYVRQRRHEQEVLLNALFGELANLYEHFSYVRAELPVAGTRSLDAQRPLQMARYGTLRALDDLTVYGFLTANDVRLLLQLSLRVRNNDLLLDLLLARQDAVSHAELAYAEARIAYTLETLDVLMLRLIDGRPNLAEIFETIKRDVPSLRNPS